MLLIFIIQQIKKIHNMCNCPQPLPPPNDQIKKCRVILQFLGGGLVIISILSILSGNIFGIFMYLLLLYMLFMSWTQFNWCFALLFFLFCITDFIQNVILLVGMIQYNLLFTSKTIIASIYVLISVFYFSTAIYFSHYCYRHFKAMDQNGAQGGMNFIPPMNPNGGDQQQAPYHRVQQPVNNNNQGGFFQGQGVRIG